LLTAAWGLINGFELFHHSALHPGSFTELFGKGSEFGFYHPALVHWKNPLRFFRLRLEFFSVRTPHNRLVEDSSLSGPTIYLISIGFL